MTDPEGQLDALARRLEELASELAAVRELAARAYDDTPALARRLFERRRSPEWQDAYAAGPLVSVRIGTYRGGDLLFDRTLASVLAQSYEHWEAIVVCDGQEPETAARIAALGDPRVRCFQRPRPGPYPEEQRARWHVAGSFPFNEAVGRARGAWIAPLDHDDEWTADHLELLLEQARRTRAEVVYGAFRALVADAGETWFGAWPPRQGDFGFQAAIYHAGLADALYDANAHLLDEPGDWNLARRLLEAGVRWDFVDRVVGTYYVDADAATLDWWRERVASRGAHPDSAASDLPPD
ncbi:MAG TPA: glycosyltransferase family 2 protein [Thermoleophilaceae bacterium]|nr:glycosyltransferase family 2 protein [Thermoleophilaceae bacterium]